MEVAWFVESGKMLHKPGLKAPNELGLYDMSGNCLEWCFDNYDATFYSEEDKTNPIGPEISLTKVCKGGNYKGVEENLRITKRYFQSPDYKDESLGFRVVRNE
jgi:formylglycine-generating enzyme required for sulfatase activity